MERNGLKNVYTELSRCTNLHQYLLLYFKNFTVIHEEYQRLFYRKLRFRRFCVAQRAYAGVINEIVRSYPPTLPPKKDDEKKKKKNDLERKKFYIK